MQDGVLKGSVSEVGVGKLGHGRLIQEIKMDDVNGARADLVQSITMYRDEYEQARKKVIKLRNKMYKCLKAKNEEQAEAYQETVRMHLPKLLDLQAHIGILNGMLTHLNKIAS